MAERLSGKQFETLTPEQIKRSDEFVTALIECEKAHRMGKFAPKA